MQLIIHAGTSTVEVRAQLSNYIPRKQIDMITHPSPDLYQIMLVKGAADDHAIVSCRVSYFSSFKTNQILTGLLFTYRTYLLQNLVKCRSREIRVLTSPIALKFDRHIGSSATEMPVKFQNDTISITSNLAASRLREIWW